MKLVRVMTDGGPRYGLLQGCDAVRLITGDPFGGFTKTARTLPLSGLKLLAPVEPGKIVAVGKNYAGHIAEFDAKPSETPILFLKPPSAVIGPGDAIVCPGWAGRVDYEGELAFVIKKKASRVKPSEAGEYILGYTCLNDVTARDIQAKDGQWVRAKGFDTFAPIGPCITGEVDPSALALTTRLNGRTVQSSSTAKLIWPVAELLAFITHCMTLLPGDVVATGTPEGIGPMRPGDTVEVEIEGIGVLKNPVA